MTMAVAGKVVSVIVMYATLLGWPYGPGFEAPEGGYTMPSFPTSVDQTGTIHLGKFFGERVLRDEASGLTIVLEPDDTHDAFFWIRGERGRLRSAAQLVVAGPADRGWPAQTIDFPWPKDRPAYSLEQTGEDAFRRTELAVREGYGIATQFRPAGQAVAVDLELSKRAFGGEYEDALDAWLGRPNVVKNVVTSAVQLEERQEVMVVWYSPITRGHGGGLQGSRPAPLREMHQTRREVPSSQLIHLAQFESGTPAAGEATVAPPSTQEQDFPVQPAGLALLMELKRWVYEPASRDLRREFEPLAKALQQATDGRARLDLQNTHAVRLEEEHAETLELQGPLFTVVPLVLEGDDAPIISAGDKQWRPWIALELAGPTEGEYWYRREYTAGGRARGSYFTSRLGMPAGPVLLARPASGEGRFAALVSAEDGLMVAAKVERGPFGDSGRGSTGEPAGAPDGAPELPFAEPTGRMRYGLGQRPVTVDQMRVWGPAPEGDQPRWFIDIKVQEIAQPENKRRDIDLKGEPLGEAIRDIGRTFDAKIILTEGVDTERPAFAQLRGVTVSQALRALLEPNELTCTKQGDIYYIHKPGEGP